MIRHVVLFRWVPEATSAQVDALSEALAELPGQIPQIRAYHFGPDLGAAAGNWDYAVTADFDSRDDHAVYRDHPAHVALIEEHIVPIRADRAAVQFDLA